MRNRRKNWVKLEKYGNYPLKSFHQPSQMDFKDPNFVIMRRKYFEDRKESSQKYNIKKLPKQDDVKCNIVE